MKFKHLMRLLFRSVAMVGGLLLILNVIGLGLSMSADLQNKNNYYFPNDVRYTRDEFFERRTKNQNETNEEYLERLNELVAGTLMHYWDDEGVQAFHLRVPIWENWLMWLGYVLNIKEFRKYEYFDFRKAIERGVGWCSQHSKIFVAVATEQGLSAKEVGLNGHVVATAEVNPDEWWIFDADYGVVIPMNLRAIEKNPDIVRSFYQQAQNNWVGKLDLAQTLDWLTRVYGKDGNKIKQPGLATHLGAIQEVNLYRWKWIIPILLLVPLISLSGVSYLRGQQISADPDKT